MTATMTVKNSRTMMMFVRIVSGADHLGPCVGDVQSGGDLRRREELRTEDALEHERNERVAEDAEHARPQDGPRHVAGGVLELAHVAHGRLKGVGRPRGDEEAAHHSLPAHQVPRAVRGCERREVAHHHVAGDQRDDREDQQRGDGADSQDGLYACGAQDAIVLDVPHREDDEGADDEHRVDAQRETILEEVQIDQGDLPRVDGGVRRIEDRQKIAGSKPRTDGQHRRPRQPVAPQGDGRRDLAVADPGGGSVYGRAAGLLGVESCDLGIRERIDETDQDGHRPDQRRNGAGATRDRAH